MWIPPRDGLASNAYKAARVYDARSRTEFNDKQLSKSPVLHGDRAHDKARENGRIVRPYAW